MRPGWRLLAEVDLGAMTPAEHEAARRSIESAMVGELQRAEMELEREIMYGAGTGEPVGILHAGRWPMIVHQRFLAPVVVHPGEAVTILPRRPAPMGLLYFGALLLALAAPAMSDQFDPLPVPEMVLPVRDLEPTPPPPDTKAGDDFALDAGLGVIASLSSEASSGEPTAEVSASFKVAENDKSPRLSLLASFRALPGETVSLSDPTTFRSLGIEGTLAQPLWSNLRLRPAVVIGAEFRFGQDEAEPLHRAARYAYLGTRVDGDAGFLFLGVGGDERLSVNSRETPQYLPAANVSWSVRLGKITGAIEARLVGRVLLFLRMNYGDSSAGSDVAQVGVLVGFGAKR